MLQLVVLLVVLCAIILVVGFVLKLVKLGIGLAVIVGVAAFVYYVFIKKKSS